MRGQSKNVFSAQHKEVKSILRFVCSPFCAPDVYIVKEALKHQNVFCPTQGQIMRRRRRASQQNTRAYISNLRIMQINIMHHIQHLALCWRFSFKNTLLYSLHYFYIIHGGEHDKVI